MQFAESGTIYTVPKYDDVFVYYLVKDGEVVYVGQTTRGLSRPLTHNDKDYDEIKFKYCSIDELDYLEDAMIKKYNPKYNRTVNHAVNLALPRARDEIREIFQIKSFGLPKLKRLIQELEIEPFMHNGIVYISTTDFDKIVKRIREDKAK